MGRINPLAREADSYAYRQGAYAIELLAGHIVRLTQLENGQTLDASAAGPTALIRREDATYDGSTYPLYVISYDNGQTWHGCGNIFGAAAAYARSQAPAIVPA
jgi:hypothetical protein